MELRVSPHRANLPLTKGVYDTALLVPCPTPSPPHLKPVPSTSSIL